MAEIKVSALLGRRWTDVEIATIIVDAGVNDWRAINLLGIALAESSGFEAAVRFNPSSVSVDLGMWQLNSRWHPEVSAQTNMDPRRQVVEVVRISKTLTWQYSYDEWVSWKTGRVKQFLGQARTAINAVRVERGLVPV